MKGEDGQIGIDRIFKYEELEKLKAYFEEKIGQEIEFPHLNVSPIEDYKLAPEIEQRLKQHLKYEYALYNNLS